MLNSYRHRFSLPIWRILHDALPISLSEQVLIVELRNKTQVEWCALQLENQQILWQKTPPSTHWWTSTVGVHAGVILLHNYAGSEQPSPQQIVALDASTGDLLWTLDGCKFEATNGHLIRTSKLSPTLETTYESWDLRDGTLFSEVLFDIPSIAPFWKTPINYGEDSSYYGFVKQFIQKTTNHIPQKTINYGENSGHVLFFYYFYPPNADTLSRSILVVNSKKTILLHDAIRSDVGSIAFDNCIYNDHHIVYLENLDELVVLKLPRP
ncbi:DUF4905 domain-containing protein [Runella sp. MFBS21]|uniref:DUF4905 domain-containing protein n=1 Tax=Runella sp. MFBS21 TaxID=3034018 RepID=UPI0023F966F8|nr:DUF4905 domain-containing protein [Runella sp. MFBS21]MDF7821522.1 DUF4905 domain-containing protein [Runella sp. MFBS21]